MTLMLLGVELFILVVQSCHALSYYRDRLPNGHNVSSPCNDGRIWDGIGHKNQDGGGARNSFGQDFAKYGRQWSQNLCMADSDGDGRTNGEELGDPNCTWSQGDPDPKVDLVTHPGICEPLNDPKCLAKDGDWVSQSCKASQFECDAIKESHVLNITLRIPRTAVPALPTIYQCQIFEIPKDQDYHIIATTPIIDNKAIMHHMVLFGCIGDVQATAQPEWCGMVPNKNCRSIVSLWGLGLPGLCQHPHAGFLIGKSGFSHLAIQYHWHNPEVRGDYFDSSGMTVYFTPQLRPHNAGMFTVGQEKLTIPPRVPFTRAEATCPGICTQDFIKGNVQILSAINHMHYLGKSQTFELHRTGEEPRSVAVDRKYIYDNPVVHVYGNPLELRPGDTLKTICDYDSSSVSEVTKWGLGTHDEMCYTFITYFPKENIEKLYCSSFGPHPRCQLDLDPVIDGCNTKTFPDLQDPTIASVLFEVSSKCPLFGDCTKPCYDAVQHLLQHPCMKEEIFKRYIVYRLLSSLEHVEFVMRLRKCQCGLPEGAVTEVQKVEDPVKPKGSTCDWERLHHPSVNHDLSLIFINVTTYCISSGYCLHHCREVVREALKHKCYRGDEWKYGRWYLHQTPYSKILEFLLDFESCNCELKQPPTQGTTLNPPSSKPTTKSVNSAMPVTISWLLAAAVLIMRVI